MRFKPDRQWRRHFAWLPVLCGTCNNKTGTAWLEWVETRDIGNDPYELPSPFMTKTFRFINDPNDNNENPLPHRARRVTIRPEDQRNTRE